MRWRGLLLSFLVAQYVDAAVTGRVVKPDGSPIEGATVRAYAFASMPEARKRALSVTPNPVPLATAETGADGSFRLDWRGPVVVSLNVDAAEAGRIVVPVTNGEDAGVLIANGIRQRGVILADGKPLANALVWTGGGPLARTRSDGMVDLQFGPDGFAVIHSGYPLQTPQPVRFSTKVQDVVDWSISSATTTVRGRVVGRSGDAGVANATISIDGWPLGNSGEDGTFVIENVARDWKTITASEGSSGGMASRGAGDITIRMQPLATITGVVRRTPGDEPVAGAVVHLTRDGDSRVAVSDNRGVYRFDAVPRGSWFISAMRPPLSRVAGPHDITVEPGASVQRDIAVTKGATVAGIVNDDAGKPVPGALVLTRAQSATFSAADGRFRMQLHPSMGGDALVARKAGFVDARFDIARAKPGDDIRDVVLTLRRGFEFELLAIDGNEAPIAGERVVIATAQSGTFGWMQNLCDARVRPCETDAAGRFAMMLAPGAYDIVVGGSNVPRKRVNGVDLSTSNRAVTVTLEQGAEVSGRVENADGSPLTGPVNVAQRSVPFEEASATTTALDGTFVLRALPARKVTILATLAAPGVEIDGPEVTVTAPATDVVLKLPDVDHITGRVIDKQTGEPITSFAITEDRRHAGGSSSRSTTRQSVDGTFAITVPRGTEMNVIVSAPGYLKFPLPRERKSNEAVLVALDRGASIRGTVTGPDGKGISGAEVRLMAERLRATTDAQGNYSQSGVTAGEHVAHVSAEGFVATKKSVTLTQSREARLDFTLERGIEISGSVVDEAGKPVGDARVMVESGGARTLVYSGGETDGRGTFTLFGLPEGTYTLIATATGYVPARELSVTGGRQITFILKRGGTISGRVTGLAPNELSEVAVYATGQGMLAMGQGTHAMGRAASTGEFKIAGIEDGDYVVHAVMPAFNPRRTSERVPTTVSAGVSAPVNVVFAEGIVVRGRLTRNGRAVPGAVVTFQKDYTSPPGLTDSSGLYDLILNDPGEYLINVQTGGAYVVAGRVSIAASMTHDIDLRGSDVAGRVIDAATGNPINMASVRLWDAQRTTRRGATTDATGRFAFPLVDPGKYQLEVTAPGYVRSAADVDITGTPEEIVLRVRPGQQMVLQILDEETRRPIESASVTVQQGGKSIDLGHLSYLGDGRIGVWLEPGAYALHVRATGYGTRHVNVNVPQGELLVLMPVAGRVVVTGQLAGASYYTLTNLQTGRGAGSAWMSPGVVEGVLPGAYKVKVFDNDKKVIAEYTVVVTKGMTSTVALN